MAKQWAVNDGEPDKLDRYEWKVPLEDQQHVIETNGPGELRLNPEDITEDVTLAPKRSGIQSGWTNWDSQVEPNAAGAWYLFGIIEQEND